MELNETLPDRVVELFEEETPNGVTARTGPLDSQSLQLHEPDSDYYGIEFSRRLGQKVIEQTDYAVTGMHHQEDQGYIEVWFDPVSSDDNMEYMTVAQRAAICLSESSSATLKPNISSEPKEQYVDVYPDPHEQAAEDYSLKDEDMARLREEGLEIRCMSCGRERGTFNEENYRIWFSES